MSQRSEHLFKAGARIARSGDRLNTRAMVRWCRDNGLTKREAAAVEKGFQAERALINPSWGGVWARYGRPLGRP